MTISDFVYVAWLLGAAAFVLGLHFMNSPATARNGNLLSAAGMAIAVLATLIGLVTSGSGLSGAAWVIIVGGFLVGGAAGLWMARTVKMTAMPQLVSLFNAVGGGAAALVAVSDYLRINGTPEMQGSTAIFVVLGAAIGSVTFSGSLIASGKLQGLISGAPIHPPGGRLLTGLLALIALAGLVVLVAAASGALTISTTAASVVLLLVVAAALTFGVAMVLPIGGADMPVVISLLNS